MSFVSSFSSNFLDDDTESTFSRFLFFDYFFAFNSNSILRALINLSPCLLAEKVINLPVASNEAFFSLTRRTVILSLAWRDPAVVAKMRENRLGNDKTWPRAIILFMLPFSSHLQLRWKPSTIELNHAGVMKVLAPIPNVKCKVMSVWVNGGDAWYVKWDSGGLNINPT